MLNVDQWRKKKREPKKKKKKKKKKEEEEEGGLSHPCFVSEVMAANIESLLGEISSAEDPTEELQVLKTALFSIPVNTLRQYVNRQRFNVIFSLLNSNQRLVSITHFFYTVSKLVA